MCSVLLLSFIEGSASVFEFQFTTYTAHSYTGQDMHALIYYGIHTEATYGATPTTEEFVVWTRVERKEQSHGGGEEGGIGGLGVYSQQPVKVQHLPEGGHPV